MQENCLVRNTGIPHRNLMLSRFLRSTQNEEHAKVCMSTCMHNNYAYNTHSNNTNYMYACKHIKYIHVRMNTINACICTHRIFKIFFG